MDSRLPNSGQQICGLYDLNPDKFGLENNLVTLADPYGKSKDIYNGFDFLFQLRRGAFNASGGANVGNSIQTGTTAGGNVFAGTDNCFVVDSPQQLYHCKVNTPYQTRLKLNGSYKLPWQGIQVAAVFQNSPGIVLHDQRHLHERDDRAVAGPAALRRHRERDAGSDRSVHAVRLARKPAGPAGEQDLQSAGSRQAAAELRRLQRDQQRHGGRLLQHLLHLRDATAGARWHTPTQILDGRLAKISAQIDF